MSQTFAAEVPGTITAGTTLVENCQVTPTRQVKMTTTGTIYALIARPVFSRDSSVHVLVRANFRKTPQLTKGNIMRKILAVLLLLFAFQSYAGTYSFTTSAADDTAIQTWCFALNPTIPGSAFTGGGLFNQPANAAGITAAQAKLCIRSVLNSAIAAQSQVVVPPAPTTLQQFN